MWQPMDLATLSLQDRGVGPSDVGRVDSASKPHFMNMFGGLTSTAGKGSTSTSTLSPPCASPATPPGIVQHGSGTFVAPPSLPSPGAGQGAALLRMLQTRSPTAPNQQQEELVSARSTLAAWTQPQQPAASVGPPGILKPPPGFEALQQQQQQQQQQQHQQQQAKHQAVRSPGLGHLSEQLPAATLLKQPSVTSVSVLEAMLLNRPPPLPDLPPLPRLPSNPWGPATPKTPSDSFFTSDAPPGSSSLPPTTPNVEALATDFGAGQVNSMWSTEAEAAGWGNVAQQFQAPPPPPVLQQQLDASALPAHLLAQLVYGQRQQHVHMLPYGQHMLMQAGFPTPRPPPPPPPLQSSDSYTGSWHGSSGGASSYVHTSSQPPPPPPPSSQPPGYTGLAIPLPMRSVYGHHSSVPAMFQDSAGAVFGSPVGSWAHGLMLQHADAFLHQPPPPSLSADGRSSASGTPPRGRFEGGRTNAPTPPQARLGQEWFSGSGGGAAPQRGSPMRRASMERGPPPPPPPGSRPLPPPAASLPVPSCKADIHVMDQQLQALVEKLQPPSEERLRHGAAFDTVRELLLKEWPTATVHVFGSTANDTCIVSSNDIDVCLELDGVADLDAKAAIIEKMSGLLEAAQMTDVFALPRARVPVCKFRDPATQICVDVTINNMLALANTRMLRDYGALDPRVRPLIYLVKHWAKQRNVNDSYRGTLSSYAYVLQCLALLQQRSPPVIPSLQALERKTFKATVAGFDCSYCDDLASLKGCGEANKELLSELLVAFFDYWAWRHDYNRNVISVRTGGVVSKDEKEWTRRMGSERHLVCIEDPFQTDHDLGRTIDRSSCQTLRREFERAARVLRNEVDPIAKLFEPRPVQPHPAQH